MLSHFRIHSYVAAPYSVYGNEKFHVFYIICVRICSIIENSTFFRIFSATPYFLQGRYTVFIQPKVLLYSLVTGETLLL